MLEPVQRGLHFFSTLGEEFERYVVICVLQFVEQYNWDFSQANVEPSRFAAERGLITYALVSDRRGDLWTGHIQERAPS